MFARPAIVLPLAAVAVGGLVFSPSFVPPAFLRDEPEAEELPKGIVFDVDAQPLVTQDERAAAFDSNASTYDDEIISEERFMLLPLLRWALLRKAQGDVLEVAAGTAPNLGYYKPSKVTSLTLSDASVPMLRVAQSKVAKLSWAERVQMEVVDPRAPPSDATYDTIVETFGICSYENPVAELKRLAGMLRPGGRMLLLEHGLSHWRFLNERMRRAAPDHAIQWGCWYNRDIERIVRQAGLRIVSQRRYHLGTTYMIVCEPAQSDTPQ